MDHASTAMRAYDGVRRLDDRLRLFGGFANIQKYLTLVYSFYLLYRLVYLGSGNVNEWSVSIPPSCI